MKNVSKIAFAVFAAVGLAACSSNNGGSVEDFAAYSETEQGIKDLALLAANTADLAEDKEADDVKDNIKQNGALITGSQTGAARKQQQYAKFGVFRTGLTDEDKVGGVRYEAVVTAENKLDAEKALAVLTMKKDAPISAHYEGQLAYSAKEKGESGTEHLAVNTAKFELALTDDKIAAYAVDPLRNRQFFLREGSVFNHNGSLMYKGTVEVFSGALLTKEFGTFEGVFAGNTAPAGDQGKEVYTKDTVKDALAETAGKIDTKSFQGAFAAKKHP